MGRPRNFGVARDVYALYFANGKLFAAQFDLCIYTAPYESASCITKGVTGALAMAVTP